ncbi:MAG: LCP family protein [bacterium]|nr:LCP family protein [bacterium]
MKKKIIIIVVLLCMLMGAFYLVQSYLLGTRNAVEQLVANKQMINILVAGSNKYREHKHRFFAILSIVPEKNNVGVTFIPPSFKIYLDDKKEKFSSLSDIDFGDFDKIRASLNDDLKLNIPFYVELYATDVKRIVDLAEGVELFILDQGRYNSNVKFGINYFDGKKINEYINSVEVNSIYLKYDRVQDILSTLYYKKESKRKFLNMEFITEMMDTVRTNFQPQEMFKIGELLFQDGDIFSTTLPGGFDQNGQYITDRIAYKIYEKEFLTPIIINAETEPVAKIKILNGTSVSGLARKMRNILMRDGLNVVEFGTSSYPQMKKSIIISRKGNHAAVRKVSELTGIERVFHVIDSTVLTNILIIIGEDLAH